jgi:FkbM family methyltransferase
MLYIQIATLTLFVGVAEMHLFSCPNTSIHILSHLSAEFSVNNFPGRSFFDSHPTKELLHFDIRGDPCGPFLREHHVYLRPRTSDTNIYANIFLRWEFKFLDNLFINREPKSILDLGGNCGLSSLYLGLRFASATIVSVEPYLPNFRLMRLNTAQTEKQFLELGSIGTSAGVISLSQPGKSPSPRYTGFRIIHDNPSDETFVPEFTIMQVAKKYGWTAIDYVKIDIEGTEKNLCEEGASWLPLVRCLSIEMHDRMVNGCSASCRMAFLSAGLYRVGLYDELEVWCRNK